MTALEKLEKNGVHLDYDEIVRLCKKYGLKELAVFGSSIRDDFKEDSDVDFLISYEDQGVLSYTLFDLVRLKDDFTNLLNRHVDIVEKEALRNPMRKKMILSTAEVIYANQ